MECRGKNDIFLGGEGSKTNVIFLNVDKFLLIPKINTVFFYNVSRHQESGNYIIRFKE